MNYPLASDVDVTVLQARVFGHLIGALVDWEWRRLGDVENVDETVLQLNAASGQTIVAALRRTLGNDAGNAHHILGANIDNVVDHT